MRLDQNGDGFLRLSLVLVLDTGLHGYVHRGLCRIAISQ